MKIIIYISIIFSSLMLSATERLIDYQVAQKEFEQGDIFNPVKHYLKVLNNTFTINNLGAINNSSVRLPLDNFCKVHHIEYDIRIAEGDYFELHLIYQANCGGEAYTSSISVFRVEENLYDVGMHEAFAGFNLGKVKIIDDKYIIVPTVGQISVLDRETSEVIFKRSDLYERFKFNSTEDYYYDEKTSHIIFDYTKLENGQQTNEKLCFQWPLGSVLECN